MKIIGIRPITLAIIILIPCHRYHPNPKFLPFPSQHVSIRGIQEETYCVIDVTRMDRPKLLEEIEFHRALFETYEGAVVCVCAVMTPSMAHDLAVYSSGRKLSRKLYLPGVRLLISSKSRSIR